MQIVDRAPNGDLSANPQTFFVQLKSHSNISTSAFNVPVETRKVGRWLQNPSTVLVAAFSATDSQLAYRTIRDLAPELDSRRPGWRENDEVGLPFRPEHVLAPDVARRTIRSWVADEADRRGGVDAFHKVRRRVLLTDLFAGTVSTSSSLKVTGQSDQKESTIFLGPGWQAGELQIENLYGPRVLACALLLYEEILLPLNFLGVALLSLGSERLVRLIATKRIVPVTTDSILGVRFPQGTWGIEPISMLPRGTETERHERDIARTVEVLGADKALKVCLFQNSRFVDATAGEAVVRQTKLDLAKADIRAQLGLSPFRKDGRAEPVWDRHLVNRLLHLNSTLAIAESMKVDVIEFEDGLAELAAQKWHSELRFNRLFASPRAFEDVLRNGGVPDLGVLEKHLGLHALADVAAGGEAQEFRDWFWSSMNEEGAGADSRREIVSQKLTRTVGESVAGLPLVLDLKLKFFSATGQDYLVGNSHLLGYSTRAVAGGVLKHQAAVQQQLRMKEMSSRLGTIEVYGMCPCGSGEKHRFCCGNRRVS